MKNTYGFLALTLRQRFLNRWGTMFVLQRESVLEHTAVVALLAMIVGELARANGKDVNLELMMSHALLHDASEVLSGGDIATPIKKANPVIQLEFEKLEEAADQQLINSAPDLLRPMLEKAFGCPSEYEKSLVKACDIYSAYIKCVMEVAAGNSIEFYDAHKDLSQRLEVVKKVHPEIATVDEWFTEGFGLSLDKLVAR